MSEAATSRTWIEISEERLASNLRVVQRAAGPQTEILAVIKADAYGHGAEQCAPMLARAGARWLGVTDAAEGIRVRAALERTGFGLETGRAPEILIMCGSLPGETSLIAGHSLTPVVWTPEHVESLAPLQQQKIHIEINTGMNRQGARPGAELNALLASIAKTNLLVDGIFTHFASAEIVGSDVTQRQHSAFEQAVAQIHQYGLHPRWVHAGNSSAIDNPTNTSQWLDGLAHILGAQPMARVGIALYGYVLPIQLADNKQAENDPPLIPRLRPELRPVLTWKAHILAIHSLAAGESVGYGATFTAPAAMRVAVLPIGYADGLRRELSNPNPHTGEPTGGWVIIHTPDGQLRRAVRAPIVGRISMNLTVIDITHIDGLTPGHEVTLLGDGITAEDHARIARTIPYEILCGIKLR